MRKLLVLLVAAAVVGVIISRNQDSGLSSTGREGPKASVARARPASPPGPVLQATARTREPRIERVRQARPASPLRGQRAERAAAEAATVEPEIPAPEPEPVLEAAAVEQAEPIEAEALALEASEPTEEVSEAVDRAVALLQAGRSLEARAILSDLYLGAGGELAARLRDL
ncbi:MAG: hypothetical protein ACYS8K_03505, partial [Planctomycetota bacterium]